MAPRPPRNPLTTVASIVAVTLVAGLFGLLAWRVATTARGSSLAAALAEGERPPAPGFELPLLDGRGTIDLGDLKGRPVVLNFWASWCEPCKAEAPRLQAAAARYPELVVVGVNSQDFEGDARKFVSRYGVTYRNVHDRSGAVLKKFGATGFPETWFVDREGRLAFRRIEGEVTDAMLAQGAAALGVR
jgi:cytochrome c biogenesis protein CcmG, thiol:disulfide interchange protein DsbE